MNRTWPGKRPKIAAALVLAASVLLPIYSIATGSGSIEHRWPAGLALEVPSLAVLLAVAYFWPFLVFGLSRARGGWRTVAGLIEPILPVVSVLVIWLVCGMTTGFVHPFGPWLFIPVGASAGVGTILATIANAVYLVAWAVAAVGLRKRGRVAEAM